MDHDIKTVVGLKERLENLHYRQDMQTQEFKIASERFADRISPKTMVRNAIHNFSARPAPNQSPIDLVIGILAGAATNRIYAPKKAGLIRKLTAPVITYMVANFVKNKIAAKRLPSG